MKNETAIQTNIIEFSPWGILTTDLSGIIVSCNSSFLQVTGYEKHEIIGKDFSKIPALMETDVSDYKAIFNDLIKGQERVSFIFEWHHKDGTHRFAKCHAGPLKQEDEIVGIQIHLRENTEEETALKVLAENIIKRKEAEKSLKEGEKKYRIIAENTNDAIWILGLESMRLEYISPAIVNISGYTPENHIARPLEEIFAPQSYGTIMEILSNSLEAEKNRTKDEGEITRRAEWQEVHKDGHFFWIEAEMKFLRDDDGIPNGVIGVSRDISQRKKTEIELKNRNEFIETILDNLPIGLSVNNVSDGAVTYTNKALIELYGHDMRSIPDIESYFKTVYPDPEYRKKIQTRVLDDIASGDPSRMKWDDIKITTRTGEEKFITAINIPLLEQNMMISTAQDNTERYKAIKKLENSEQRFRLSITEAPNPIMIHAEDGEVILINNTWSELSGYSPDEIPTLAEWVKKAYAGLGKTMIANIETLRGIDSRVNMGEYEITTKNGQKRFWDFSAVPIGYLSDGRKATMDMAVDVTDRKQAEEQRIRLESQLRQSQKMESLGTLAGGIAHDFNNILFPITGYTEMILQDLSSNSPLRHNLNQILKSAKRARDLVKQILAFSRQTEQEVKPIDLKVITKEVLKLIRSTIPSTIEVSHSLSEAPCVVMADPTQIHQIAMNLITNAFHAMENGGKLEIKLSRQQLDRNFTKDKIKFGPYACLSVSDTGNGMEKSIIEKIFEPYFTTKETGKGTGLGLSVVHGIVTSYNGNIVVDSEPGRGTTISVFLPLIENISEDRTHVDGLSLKRGEERILLVDDEDAVLQIVKRILELLGYSVTTTNSGLKAAALFKQKPLEFDLVITDMTMPKMTGVQLARELKDIRKEIPIIICTGFSEQLDKKKADALGFEGFISKPVLINKISETIRNVLDGNDKTI